MITICDHLRRLKFSSALPVAFTEHGAIMAASLLNSPNAIAMSVFVVRAFVQMRERLAVNRAILDRIAEIDATLLEHDHELRALWTSLRPLLEPPPDPHKPRIGFHSHAPPPPRARTR